MQLASAHLGLLLAANSTAKNNGFSADNSPVVWFALTGFSLALALVGEILAYRARKANKDDRYQACKRGVWGLLTMALLQFLRALALRH